jgi:hypothetical protein
MRRRRHPGLELVSFLLRHSVRTQTIRGTRGKIRSRRCAEIVGPSYVVAIWICKAKPAASLNGEVLAI